MKLDDQTELFFKNTLGISPLSATTGFDAFVRGIASGRSQFAVLEGVQEKVELRPRPDAPNVTHNFLEARQETAFGKLPGREYLRASFLDSQQSPGAA